MMASTSPPAAGWTAVSELQVGVWGLARRTGPPLEQAATVFLQSSGFRAEAMDHSGTPVGRIPDDVGPCGRPRPYSHIRILYPAQGPFSGVLDASRSRPGRGLAGDMQPRRHHAAVLENTRAAHSRARTRPSRHLVCMHHAHPRATPSNDFIHFMLHYGHGHARAMGVGAAGAGADVV